LLIEVNKAKACFPDALEQAFSFAMSAAISVRDLCSAMKIIE
jgi:hypothetical protein